jgi:hypothetical protein
VLVLSTASPTFTHIANTLVPAVLIPTFLIFSFLFEIPPHPPRHCCVCHSIEWVQQHCPVTNIKAQLYCQKWGLEKLTNLFNKIAYRQMIAALEKWSEFVDYQNNQDKAENYMKWKGSRRLVKMLEDFDTKQKAGGWDKWVHVIMHQRKREQNKSATDIERVARGFMGRRRVLNICTWEQRLRRLVLCAGVVGCVVCCFLCAVVYNIPSMYQHPKHP